MKHETKIVFKNKVQLKKQAINMEKTIYLSIISIFTLLGFLSCNDEDEIAGMLLYDNQGSIAVNISFNMQHAAMFPFSEITTHGLDVSVTNNNDNPVTDVYITITEVSPYSDWAEYSTESKYISYIDSWSTEEPTEYWCYNCNTADEDYIGHFWVDTYSWVSNGSNIEVTFSIEFIHNGNQQTIEQTRSFITK